MFTVNSSRLFFRKSNWSFLLVLIYFLLVSWLPVEAQAPTKENVVSKKTKEGLLSLFESVKKNPWSNIKGFRSAKFGVNEKSVYRAIVKDFKLAKNKVKKNKNTKEQTTTLTVDVPDLFRIGGTAKVGYILGYKSKKLIHINVLWGLGAAEKVDGQSVIDTANMLRAHFIKKRYQEKGLNANAKLSAAQTLVFSGRDQKNRMILLLLTIQPKQKGQTDEQVMNRTSLLLSYISNPDKPDIRDISIKEGEF